MIITNVRIRNFRSVSDEVGFPIARKCALIGPNNSGKTNILRAINLFFSTRHESIVSLPFYYDKLRDFPEFIENGRTTIQIIFQAEDSQTDTEILELYNDIKHILRIPVRDHRSISVLLSFSDNGRPSYQVFPSSKRPTAPKDVAELNDVTEVFLERLFSNFAVHYIQSDKRFNEIYETLLLPSVKQEIAAALENVYQAVKSSIFGVNEQLNRFIADMGLSEFSIRLTPPEDVVDFIKDIEFRLEDGIESGFESKGMGLQALAMMSSMLWLQTFYQENERSIVWLIEEPESFLHPSLLPFQIRILNRLSQRASVIYATHALGLVPHNTDMIVGVDKISKQTKIKSFSTVNDATKTLRSLLGVRFGDFYNLPDMVIGVEGPTDKQYLEWFLSIYKGANVPDKHSWPLLRQACVVDYGGIGSLRFFIQSTYEFIRREALFVALFDADEAGTRTRVALQEFFSDKNRMIGYQSRQDFVSTRLGYSIEGMFSDAIIKDLHKEMPSIFHSYSEDSEGTVEPFRLDDKKKTVAFQHFIARAESDREFDWARRFIGLCEALEEALQYQRKRLHKIVGEAEDSIVDVRPELIKRHESLYVVVSPRQK